MFMRLGRWLDPVLLVGLFVSVVISAAMVLTGNDTLSSIIVGLLSTIITLLIDLLARIQKAENSFLNATGLLRILSNESRSKALRELASIYEGIAKFNFDHYYGIADAAIDECEARLLEIASGSVLAVMNSMQAYGLRGIQQARQDIKVVYKRSMDWWASDYGKKCFAAERHLSVAFSTLGFLHLLLKR